MADVLPSFEAGFAYPLDGEVTSPNLKQLVENAAPRPNLIAQRADYSPSTDSQLAPNSAKVLLLDDDRIFKSSGDAWLNLRSDPRDKRLSLGKDSGQTGLHNVFVGHASGQHVTGNSNTSIGSNALSKATTASENTAIGNDALFNHQGELLRNTAVGYQALAGNKEGANTWNAHNNVAVGVKAARELIKGDHNVAIGNAAMEYGDGTTHCVAIGNQSLWKSTTGSQSIAVGTGALQYATNPSNSIAIGIDALKRSGVGSSSNIAIGGRAGEGCTSDQNVLIGTEAGKFLSSGSNIAIGWKAMASSQESTLANCITVGANAVATRSNQVALGGTQQTHVKIPVLPSGETAVAQLGVGELYTLEGVVKQVQ